MTRVSVLDFELLLHTNDRLGGICVSLHLTSGGMFSAIFKHLLVGKNTLGNSETRPQMSAQRKEGPSGLSPRH